MQINSINLHTSSKEVKLKKLKEVCNKFESEILQFYLKEAMKSDDALFPNSPGEKIYKSMYQQTLSDNLSGQFGYSQLLFNFLKNKI